MARGDPILCQDPGDVLQFANQTRSEALVALFDDTMAIKRVSWIDPGRESSGISAEGGDTFAVANEDGRMLYSHTMPAPHSSSFAEKCARKLLNIENELGSAMHLMGILEKHSEDLMQQVDFVEKQLVRNNAANDERTLVDQKMCLLAECEHDVRMHAPDVLDDPAVRIADEAWETIAELNAEAARLADRPASDLMCLHLHPTHAAGEQGIDVRLAKAGVRGLPALLRGHDLAQAQQEQRRSPRVLLK